MATGSTLNGQLREALLTLQAETPGLLGAVLVSTAGLTIVSTLPGTAEPDVVAAMAAPLLALSERTAKELWHGQLSQVLIKGQQGSYVLVERVNSQVAIVALASKDAKLGFVFMNITRTSATIARIIKKALEAHPAPRSPHITRAAVRKFRRLK
jgi:predicted regulator of Ras-like GTPase activity (Roadblock/LC7/MglB family)